jgi:hypothetical protein
LFARDLRLNAISRDQLQTIVVPETVSATHAKFLTLDRFRGSADIPISGRIANMSKDISETEDYRLIRGSILHSSRCLSAEHANWFTGSQDELRR